MNGNDGGTDEDRMTVWPDPMTEQQSKILRELTTRVLVETDAKKLEDLIQQMTRIIERHIHRGSEN